MILKTNNHSITTNELAFFIKEIETPEQFEHLYDGIKNTEMQDHNKSILLTMLTLKSLVIKSENPSWEPKDRKERKSKPSVYDDETKKTFRESQSQLRGKKREYCLHRNIKTNSLYEQSFCRVCPVCGQYLLTDIDSHYVYSGSRNKYIHECCMDNFISLSKASGLIKDNCEYVGTGTSIV